MRKSFATISILLIFVLLCPRVSSAEWAIEVVDRMKGFSKDPEPGAVPLVLDASGLPHIAYGEDHLYHARFNGEEWETEIVDPEPGVGKFANIAIDYLGRIHICYWKWGKI